HGSGAGHRAGRPAATNDGKRKRRPRSHHASAAISGHPNRETIANENKEGSQGFYRPNSARIFTMAPEAKSRLSLGLQGSAALLVALAVVAILLITLPAYRIFFLISVLIGLVIAGGLALWHKLRPIKDDDVENKRPLGL